jgi:hypothetical protein
MPTMPAMPTTARPVTGPDGDNPITDEQIRELRADYFSDHTSYTNGSELSASAQLDVFDVALWPSDVHARAWLTPAEARTRCAAAWNARQGGAA